MTTSKTTSHTLSLSKALKVIGNRRTHIREGKKVDKTKDIEKGISKDSVRYKKVNIGE